MAQMDSKVGRVRRATSTAGRIDGGAGEGGFTLIEVICVIAILGVLAAMVLPSIPRGTSIARLQSYALETARLLKDDRNAAVRRGVQVDTMIDSGSRSVRSGATGRVVRIPDDVAFDAVLAARCDERRRGTTIDFFPSGMSCGGTISLMRSRTGFQIRVNWLTGGIEVVPIHVL